jgi:hypothetical protein
MTGAASSNGIWKTRKRACRFGGWSSPCARRTACCTTRPPVETIGQLIACRADQLLKIRNFGQTSLKEVRARLEEFGLKLKGE